MIAFLLSESVFWATEQEQAERVEIESAQRPPEHRPTTHVGGGGEVQHLFQQIRKPASWDQNLQTICAIKVMAVRIGFRQLEDYLAAAKDGSARHVDDAELLDVYQNLAQLWAYQGKLDQTIK